jgi:deazaflavin-dependent oxidoreductase (nitroreductase family)
VASDHPIRGQGTNTTPLGAPGLTQLGRHLPWWVPYFNRVAKPLLALGVPIGPDLLITVQGRKTGLPRTTPVTICEYGGRRGLISPFGETNWVRNLRATGTATIGFGRRRERVRAVELGNKEAVGFIRDVIVPIARHSRFGDWFVRNVDRIDLDNPEEAVVGRPVFEILPNELSSSAARFQ